MPTYQESYRNAVHALRRYGPVLLQDVNVHAIGVGHKITKGVDTGEPCVTIFVHRKLPAAPMQRQLPLALPGPQGQSVPTDVIEQGVALDEANTAKLRPAQPGTSIGEISITAGTFGGVVVDGTTGETLILSNNHVLADESKAPLGSPVVQPGPFDGGVMPADLVATLLRFVPYSTTQANYVDAAVARPTNPSLIGNQPLNAVPAPSPSVPAVALHWAGNGSPPNPYSLGCSIQMVLTLLGVDFPEPASVAIPYIGMSVQKTGRSTERTEGTITNLHVMTNKGGGIRMVEQIQYTRMTESGDSGSIIVLNP